MIGVPAHIRAAGIGKQLSPYGPTLIPESVSDMLCAVWRSLRRGRTRAGMSCLSGPCESDALKMKIRTEGFGFTPIKKIWPDPADLKTTNTALHDRKGWLILDRYHFTPEYHRAVLNSGSRLLIIDDINHLPEYHADILLNQNLYAPDINYQTNGGTTVLLGTRYALLRRDFRLKRKSRRIPLHARKILVSLGGSDPDNITLKAVEALLRIDIPRLQVKIVVGPANKNRTKLEHKVQERRDFEIITNADNMPDLMDWADLAVTAGGGTCWELAYMGPPFLILMTADNQESSAEALEEEFAGINLGYGGEVSVVIASRLRSFMIDPEKRAAMSGRCRNIVAGRGNQMLIRLMSGEKIKLRPVLSADCERIWRWANDDSVRAFSFSKAPIAWADHVFWFEKRIKSPHFYLGLNLKDLPIGQVRFDRNGTETFISVMVDRSCRKQGYGAALIMMACERLFSESGIMEVHAYVVPDNKESRRAFTKAGFREAPACIRQGRPARHFILDRSYLEEELRETHALIHIDNREKGFARPAHVHYR